ncbi:hypothetical protein HNP99_002331 [Flavobacterium sp. 28A]|nr:hypothetical protein [Flavobacterium sp. 28A]NRT15971.1 hypothetical protein [Flavobacterium sp. 28A]
MTKRFHFQKITQATVQEIRIRVKWEVIDKENTALTESNLY